MLMRYNYRRGMQSIFDVIVECYQGIAIGRYSYSGGISGSRPEINSKGLSEESNLKA